jgi:competence CoiA-like predicted nuclease
MSLTAMTKDEDVIYSPELTDDDRKKAFYFCRNCNVEMRLRIPKNKITHFTHLPNDGCGLAGESALHMEAKKYFFDLYKNDDKYRTVEMERRLWNDERIGDVVLYPENVEIHPTVIEVQNSPIGVDEIHQRFDDWNEAEHAMLWILTANRINPFAEDEIRVPGWVKLLHRLYAGRVYVYHDNDIYAVHFESVTRDNEWTGSEYYLKNTKTITNKIIKGHNLFQTRPFRGYPKVISRFYDKKFWGI